MKIITFLAVAAGLTTLQACATKDTKNEVESYPTYDTTQKMEKKNDSVSPHSVRDDGDMRNNIER